MPPLRIIILSDGRPGHFNLSEGIAAAIERARPATTIRYDVRRGRWSGSVLAAMTRARLPARAMLARVYGVDESAVPPADIIVSAGAETLAASIWLARARGVPNIHYGSLRLFDPHDFSLVLTSYRRHADRPRHALSLKPSRFDPDTSPPLGDGPRRTLGVLVGGNAGGIQFTPGDWDGLFAMIRKPRDGAPVRWLIANSRRTPAEIGDRLAVEAARPGSPIAQFLDVRTAGPGTLPMLMARCHAVLCTADSSSMISECVWSRKPTLALTPATCGYTQDEAGYRHWLQQSNWCKNIAIASATPAAIDEALAQVRPLTGNPLDALAGLLRQRLPGLLP